MSQASLTKASCFICGNQCSGEAVEIETFVNDGKTTAGHISGFQCKSCGIAACSKCKKKINFNLFTGWAKAICPKCKNLFQPAIMFIDKNRKTLLSKSNTLFDNSHQFLKALLPIVFSSILVILGFYLLEMGKWFMGVLYLAVAIVGVVAGITEFFLKSIKLKLIQTIDYLSLAVLMLVILLTSGLDEPFFIIVALIFSLWCAYDNFKKYRALKEFEK